MSTDKWSTCPKCEKRRNETVKRLEIELSESYGNVTEDEYNELQWEIEKVNLQDKFVTLREVYKIGIFQGKPEFSIYYQAHCIECSFGYRYEKKIEIEESELPSLPKRKENG